MGSLHQFARVSVPRATLIANETECATGETQRLFYARGRSRKPRLSVAQGTENVRTKKKKVRALSPAEEIQLVQHKLGYVTFERDEESYRHIDLGHPDINEIFGDRNLGIRIGSMIEIFGPESSGKTLIATRIAAIAQEKDPEHTYVAKIDLERSNDDRLNARLGIDMTKFYLFAPKVAASLKGMKKLARWMKSKNQKLVERAKKKLQKYEQTAEQICNELEAWVKYRKEQDPEAVIIVIVDSVTGMLVSEEEEAGLADQNMRTKVSLASFLSILCRRWVRFAANYDLVEIFINQERTAPGVMFGNPNYTSGGRALKFYASVRVRASRVKNGFIKKGLKIIGIRSKLVNQKNKVGGEEHHSYGFKCLTRKSNRFKWISLKDADKEARKKDGE